MTSDTSGNGRPSPSSGDRDRERWPDEAQSGRGDDHGNGNGAGANGATGATGATRMGATNGSHHNTTFSDPIFLDDADDHITNDPDPVVADTDPVDTDPDPVDELPVDDPDHDHDPDPDLGAIDLDIDMIVVEAEIIDDLPDEPEEPNGVVDAVIVDDEPAPPPPVVVDGTGHDIAIAPEPEIDLDDAVADLDPSPPPAATAIAPQPPVDATAGDGDAPRAPRRRWLGRPSWSRRSGEPAPEAPAVDPAATADDLPPPSAPSTATTPPAVSFVPATATPPQPPAHTDQAPSDQHLTPEPIADTEPAPAPPAATPEPTPRRTPEPEHPAAAPAPEPDPEPEPESASEPPARRRGPLIDAPRAADSGMASPSGPTRSVDGPADTAGDLLPPPPAVFAGEPPLPDPPTPVDLADLPAPPPPATASPPPPPPAPTPPPEPQVETLVAEIADPAPTPGTDPAPSTDATNVADPAPTPEADPPAATQEPLPPTEPQLLELRQIAGLTAGVVMDLEESTYDFAEGDEAVGFSIRLDDHDRAIIVPGAVEATIDALPVTGPTPIGSGVLDVGSARFVARPKRQRKRATDWLDQHAQLDQPEPEIEVPPGMTAPEPNQGRLSRWRSRNIEPDSASTVATWEFVEQVRETRTLMAERERFHHPDPAELAVRATHRAPVLGMRPPGHPHFAKVAVIAADQPWLPNFDNIHAIPEGVGYQIQPLLSLPSVPVAADLLVGPLGIVGSRAATMAVARHAMLSLYGLSTADLRLHVATSDERSAAWEWAHAITTPEPIRLDHGFPVVVIDGMEHFGSPAYGHQDAIDRRLGVIILADSVEDLPSYCGTVLQLAPSGTALLTNHLGKVINGTPIGVATATATTLADQLVAAIATRRRR